MLEKPSAPAACALFSAILWGVWWIPIVYLASLGLGGVWGSVSMHIGVVVLLLVGWMIGKTQLQVNRTALIGGFVVAMAVVLYSAAILLSDVVRVVLLFYLAPAWGKLIEWAFMGQGWRWMSTLTISCSLLGAFLVLGGELSIEGINTGDVLAVLAGMAWAGGAAILFSGERVNSVSLTFYTALFSILLGLCVIWIWRGTELSGGVTTIGLIMGSLIGIVYVFPLSIATLWSAQRLLPALVSFLLTAEILSGVISAALLLDETYGLIQLAGTILILLAAGWEVIPHIKQRSKT